MATRLQSCNRLTESRLASLRPRFPKVGIASQDTSGTSLSHVCGLGVLVGCAGLTLSQAWEHESVLLHAGLHGLGALHHFMRGIKLSRQGSCLHGRSFPASFAGIDLAPGRLDGEEDVKRSLSDLWCAVSGDQRTLGILSSKMEDAVRDFSRLWPGSIWTLSKLLLWRNL